MEQFNKENIAATGMVKILHRNAAGETIREFEVPNLVVTSGKTFIASKIIATTNSPVSMTHMAIGTSATTPDAAQGQLIAEVGRVSCSSSTATNTVTFTATFPAGTGTSTSPGIQEAAVFNSGTAGAGTMLCRTTFPSVGKSAGDTIAVTWVVTVG